MSSIYCYYRSNGLWKPFILNLHRWLGFYLYWTLHHTIYRVLAQANNVPQPRTEMQGPEVCTLSIRLGGPALCGTPAQATSVPITSFLPLVTCASVNIYMHTPTRTYKSAIRKHKHGIFLITNQSKWDLLGGVFPPNLPSNLRANYWTRDTSAQGKHLTSTCSIVTQHML